MAAQKWTAVPTAKSIRAHEAVKQPRIPTETSVSNQTRTLIVRTVDGEVTIVIPPKGRVTFGPDVPQSPSGNISYGVERTYALRVYRSRENNSLCAVIPHVFGFRDDTVQITRTVLEGRSDEGMRYRMVAKFGPHSTTHPSRYELYNDGLDGKVHGPTAMADTEDQAREILTRAIEASNRILNSAKEGASTGR